MKNQIQDDISGSLKQKIANHNERFKKIFKARYQELLPSLINYKNAETVSVDFLKVEVALRSGYDVVIGETTNKNIQVIGYVKSKKTITDPSDLFSNDLLRHGDIKFVIDERLKVKHYKEISYKDSCQSGNFVVLRNKTINRISDYTILKHYVDELSEINLSRFSISMQVKISTLFRGEPNDESLNKIINEIYNGNPYIKGNTLFDPEDDIISIKNEGIAQNFQELKREFQNKISELNNMLGINSLAVEKSSGVSDEEAKSNRAYTTSNSNIYLDSRNNPLKCLNKRYDLELEAVYNDEVVSELLEKEEEQEAGEEHADNNSI